MTNKIKKIKAAYFNYLLLVVFAIPFMYCNLPFNEDKNSANQSINQYEGIKIFKSSPGSKNTVLILTGFGQSPDSIVNKHQLFKSLLKKDFDLAFINIANKNQTLYVSHEELSSVAKQINLFISNTTKDKKTYSLLGFSIGGSACLKLLSDTDFCTQNKINKCIVIDPPLDLERLYNSLLRQNQNSKNAVSKNESNFLLNFCKQNYNLNPTTKAHIFWSNSIFASNDSIYRNYERIKNKNILIFTNNDSAWQRVQRDRLPIDMNISDCMPFYERIRTNNTAKLIIMKNNNAMLNPHSWDNIDESAIINWLQ